jgi:hypothetical protein
LACVWKGGVRLPSALQSKERRCRRDWVASMCVSSLSHSPCARCRIGGRGRESVRPYRARCRTCRTTDQKARRTLLQGRGSERTGRRPVLALYVLAENRDWRSAHGPHEITRRPQVRLAVADAPERRDGWKFLLHTTRGFERVMTIPFACRPGAPAAAAPRGGILPRVFLITVGPNGHHPGHLHCRHRGGNDCGREPGRRSDRRETVGSVVGILLTGG